MRQLPGPPSYSTATTEGSVSEKDAAKKFGGRAEGNYKPPHNDQSPNLMVGEGFGVQVTFCFSGGLTMGIN